MKMAGAVSHRAAHGELRYRGARAPRTLVLASRQIELFSRTSSSYREEKVRDGGAIACARGARAPRNASARPLLHQLTRRTQQADWTP
jgi:hypothetical protein